MKDFLIVVGSIGAVMIGSYLMFSLLGIWSLFIMVPLILDLK